MMVEEYELKQQQESSFWRTAFSLLSADDTNWLEVMPLPLIDKDILQKHTEEKLTPEEQEYYNQRYLKSF